MKTLHKVLLMALMAIFSFGYASADFRFGIKAGLNFNKLDYKIKNWDEAANQLKDPSNQAGWMAGVMADFTIPVVNIGADLSLLYARQNLSEAEKEYYDNKDFLDIPLNLKWKIGIPIIKKFVSPIIFTGPDFMFALTKNTIDDLKAKKCDVGWNVGLGLEICSHVQIEGAYCFGLNNVAKYAKVVDVNLPTQTTQDLKAKKNYWTITAAYLF